MSKAEVALLCAHLGGNLSLSFQTSNVDGTSYISRFEYLTGKRITTQVGRDIYSK